MLDCFENKLIHNVHASRYIASFANVGGDPRLFRKWLNTHVVDGEKLTQDEIRFIMNLAQCGKLEFETNAKKFLRNFYKKIES